MNWKGSANKRSWSNRGIVLEFAWSASRKPRKSFIQNSRCPSRDSNQARPEFKSTALPIDQPVLGHRVVW
jgi:hypothetical protein